MFKKKRWIAASMVMAMAVTGCGDKAGADPTPQPTTPTAYDTGGNAGAD